MNTIIGIIAAIIIFGILVVVHEGGHFTAAKLSGVRVNEFSVGMGPLIFSRKKGDTAYSLRLLPIGGYVALEGEEGDSEDERAFSAKPAWVRIIILAAGPFMNFAFAVAVLTAMIMILGHVPVIFQALILGIKNCLAIEGMILQSLWDLISGSASLNDLVGPVGIVDTVNKTAQQGITSLVGLTVVLSLNLGLFNILPFPALDGGRILFAIIRALTGRAVSDEVENAIHFAGLMLLFGFMIIITIKDVNVFILN